MKETTKARQYWGLKEKMATQGRGIDIGCGPDPVTPDTRGFDLEHGDANEISKYVHEQFDFVYASHCLEHMHDPRKTILDWWKLVKVGGFIFIAVPDEDLYEQGVFPSRFNNDHKATFTISKAQSWSAKSINVLDLANSLPQGQIVSLELQDRGYNRMLMGFGKLPPPIWIRLFIKVTGLLGLIHHPAVRRLITAYYPLDQTSSAENAQAQIQLIVKKLG